MTLTKTRPIRLKDYQPSAYLIDTVTLDISLHATRTRVHARLAIRPNPKAEERGGPLILNGVGLELESVSLNGAELKPTAYIDSGSHLTITKLPKGPFELDSVVWVNPEINKALMGLYRSKSVYCSQCEAEGFRRITFMLDRPDVMARYRVRMEADVAEAPVLLSNGDLLERGTLRSGRHYAIWEDPHPKPCYLFALVAGDLGSIASTFVTASGRSVDLRIYVEHGKEPRAAWAMDALKRCMAWDERVFGREYDLSQFNIVAVSDFNMGAMENKGLNIFNDRLILASADTATDANFEAIESVVAHEYFHNWTGNRITCRDWFQLCLKEGLTVYRDQEFSSDERSRPVQRISDVRQLRSTQFPEDAGPLAHPVRPQTYIEINNFYTATIYEKGAELVRMLATILGPDLFRAGMDLYFARHDGEAATIEDFIACFEAASGDDLSQFYLWYSQVGTPKIGCEAHYDAKRKSLTLTFTQLDTGTQLDPGHTTQRRLQVGPKSPRKPMLIPIRFALLGRTGAVLPIKAETTMRQSRDVLVLSKTVETVRFVDVQERPTLSLLRGFSAPVHLQSTASDRDLSFLAAHDSDLFNRWQALNQFAIRTLVAMYRALSLGKRSNVGAAFVQTLGLTVRNNRLEPAYRAELLRLPSAMDLAREIGHDVDPGLVVRAHRQLSRGVGRLLGEDLEAIYRTCKVSGPYSPDATSTGWRALRNASLSLLCARGTQIDTDRLAAHYFSAKNMTDQAHSLALLAQVNTPVRAEALAHFFDRWHHDDLVIDTWFGVQAQSNLPRALDDVKALSSHQLFRLNAPNKVRALFMTFAANNLAQFHRADGAGYELIADQVLAINGFNPQIAARLLSSFKSWRTLEPSRSARARAALERVLRAPRLSQDVQEIAARMLAD
jgi:aminopeptidase N